MSRPVVIQTEGVGKAYQRGLSSEGPSRLLSEALGERLRAPFRRRGGADERFWALRDVSLEIEQGEVVGLVGANGAGKSTLLKLLAQITPPTEGRITLRGRVASMLEVGTGFHPELTGRENVFLNGTILGMRRREIEERFDEIVEFSGIAPFLDTPVKRYSSGMYVRLAFAVAAHLEPEILLVDEVLAVGDAEFQRKCLGKMQSVVEGGRTIVFVSHNLSAVQRLCSRSLWIDKGKVAASGPTTDVIAAYIGSGTSATGGSVVLGDEVARLGTGDVKVRRLSLLDAEGLPTDRLFLGQEARLRMELETAREVTDGVFEVGFNAADGTRVVTAQNIDRSRDPQLIPAGRSEVDVTLAPDLLPGEFTVDVAVSTSSGLTLEFLQQVLAFKSLDASEDGAEVWPWNIVRGSVRAVSSWKLERLAESERLPAR